MQNDARKWLSARIYSMRKVLVPLSLGLALAFAGIGVMCVPQTAQAAALSKPVNNLGLVGYWSFNDGTSTKATDFSGSGNAGTLTNMANPATATSGWGNGKLGGGLNFDGTNDYVTIPDSASLDLTGNLTISLWAKRNVTGAVFGINKKSTSYTQNDGWEFYQSSATVFDFVAGGSSFLRVNGTYDNEWHHYVATVSSGTVTIYQDAVVKGSAAKTAISAGTDPVEIGRRDAAFQSYTKGTIDEVRIYNRALSTTEITSLYNAGAQKLNATQNKTGTTLDSGLVGLWSFDGNDTSGTTAYDRSGSGNNGTLTNGATTTRGKLGQAVRFDGVNDYVGAQYDLARASSTISVWIKTTTKDEGISQWSSSAYTYNGFVDRVLSLNSSGQARLYVYNGGGCTDATYYIAGGADLTDGNWHHIVGTWGPAGKYLYVDGVLAANNSVGIQSSTGAMPYLTIGEGDSSCSHSPAHQYFNGSLDDIRVYNRAVSASEVKLLYGLGTQTVNASRNTTSGSLDSGLVGLWSFDGKDMSGTTAYDRSGSGNNGTLTNGPTPAIGKIGQGLSFDGVNDYVTANQYALGTGDFAISEWVYPVSRVSSFPSLFNNYDVWGAGALGIFAGHASADITKYQVALNGVFPAIQSTDSITYNTWTHIALVRSNGVFTLYVNNLPNGTYTSSYNVSGHGSNIAFGQALDTGGGFFKGRIDEARIYNRALSASEVTALYNLGK